MRIFYFKLVLFLFVLFLLAYGGFRTYRFFGERAVSNEIGRQLQIKEKLEESLGCVNDFNCAVDLYDK